MKLEDVKLSDYDRGRQDEREKILKELLEMAKIDYKNAGNIKKWSPVEARMRELAANAVYECVVMVSLIDRSERNKAFFAMIDDKVNKILADAEVEQKYKKEMGF